jgi:dihydroorotase
MNPPLILRGARVIDPENRLDQIQDIGIAEGVFVDPATISGASVCELRGKVLCPGFIDCHVHLREPGQTHKEDIASGTRAAAAGGFSTVVAMPNTSPAVDSPETMALVQQLIKDNAVVRVLQTGALTRERDGVTLTNAQALRDSGACALSDDGSCIQDNALMLTALRQAKAAGLRVIDHCEAADLAAGGAMQAGNVAEQLGVKGQNPASEDLIVARNLIFAQQLNWPILLQHLSSAGAIELLRLARQNGIPLFGEVTPHHLCLTHEACRQYGPNAKMNPPLRSEADRQALIAALQDDTITVIATDHAPHAPAEKNRPFAEAAFGIIGLETAVPLCLSELYHKGALTLPHLVAKFTSGPRQALGLPCGTLNIGAPADVTILEPDTPHTIDLQQSRSKSRNSPFDGWKCTGKVAATLVAGEWVYRA